MDTTHMESIMTKSIIPARAGITRFQIPGQVKTGDSQNARRTCRKPVKRSQLELLSDNLPGPFGRRSRVLAIPALSTLVACLSLAGSKGAVELVFSKDARFHGKHGVLPDYHPTKVGRPRQGSLEEDATWAVLEEGHRRKRINSPAMVALELIVSSSLFSARTFI